MMRVRKLAPGIRQLLPDTLPDTDSVTPKKIHNG